MRRFVFGLLVLAGRCCRRSLAPSCRCPSSSSRGGTASRRPSTGWSRRSRPPGSPSSTSTRPAPAAQAMAYAPTADGQHIPDVAARVVRPAIEAALARAGYPPGASVDVVGYSMGGLVARYLIEKAGWARAGRHARHARHPEPRHDRRLGTGHDRGFRPVERHRRRHAARVALPAVDGPGRTGRRTVRRHRRCPHWLPFRYDGLVPSESPFLTGDEHYLVPAHHGALPRDPQAVDLTVQALGRRPNGPAPGDGGPNLTGPATVRLEYAEIAGDHDRWTDDEYRFAVSVDPDGGGDGFVPLGEISYERDAPFTQHWGDRGPTVGPLALPGTSPRIDVRVDVSEADPWGRQVIATAVFHDVMLSDDLDGMDYYEAVVPLSGGRRDVFRISLNGATSRT